VQRPRRGVGRHERYCARWGRSSATLLIAHAGSFRNEPATGGGIAGVDGPRGAERLVGAKDLIARQTQHAVRVGVDDTAGSVIRRAG